MASTHTNNRTQVKSRSYAGAPARAGVGTKARSKSKSKAAGRLLSKTASMTFSGAVIAGVAFVASTFCGQVMLESSRQQAKNAIEAADSAVRSETFAKQRVDTLTRADEVEAWALSHNFVAPEASRVHRAGTANGKSTD